MTAEGETPVPAGIVPLIEEQAIQERVMALAEEVVETLGEEFFVVGLLSGGFMVAADLLRALARFGVHPGIAFATFQSYGNNRIPETHVRLVGALPSVRGRTVLMIDDIVDTGRTMARARALLLRDGAEAVYTGCLVDKPARREVQIEPDFVGFHVGNYYVVGCGLDDAGRYRGLPFIGRVE